MRDRDYYVARAVAMLNSEITQAGKSRQPSTSKSALDIVKAAILSAYVDRPCGCFLRCRFIKRPLEDYIGRNILESSQVTSPAILFNRIETEINRIGGKKKINPELFALLNAIVDFFCSQGEPWVLNQQDNSPLFVYDRSSRLGSIGTQELRSSDPPPAYASPKKSDKVSNPLPFQTLGTRDARTLPLPGGGFSSDPVPSYSDFV